MEEPIYQRKGIRLASLNHSCPLDEWYDAVVRKTESELSLLDICRMLRQEVLLDIAMPLARKILIKSPFCGELYDGQLFKLFIQILNVDPDERKVEFFNALIFKIREEIDLYEWILKEDRMEYEELVKQFVDLHKELL